MVQAYRHDKILLETNSLGYTKHDPTVAYSDNYEADHEIKGDCVNGPPPNPFKAPDAQTTHDSTCQALGACHIAFTKSGEWVAYDFYFDDDDLHKYADSNGKLPIEVTLRGAGPPGKDRKVDLKLKTKYDKLVDQKSVIIQGKGYQNFRDATWGVIKLDPKDKHLRLFVFFVAGNTNLCSIKIAIKEGHGHSDDYSSDDSSSSSSDDHGPVDRYVPFAINALEYDDAKEIDNAVKGQCKVGQPPIDEADAQTTKDVTCRKLGPCHVSFTHEGESVTYRFKTDKDSGKQYVDVTARVATAPGSRKTFKMEIVHGNKVEAVEYFDFKGKGYHDFVDVTWRNVPIDTSYAAHKLVIGFTNGNINLCSVSVDWNDKRPTLPPHPHNKPTPRPVSKPTPAPTHPHYPHPTPPHGGDTTPITFAAFDFDDAYDKSPKSSSGNCYEYHRDGVDGSYTSDHVCRDRDDSHCFVGFTEAHGKMMKQSLTTEYAHEI
ncbi:MAG: hypothetical protein SGILL_001824 [Bacillariaceae sp.]